MKKKVIVIIMVFLLLGAGVGSYFLFFNKPQEDKVVLYPYTPGEYFVTNVKGGNRLLKTTIVLMVDKEKLTGELKENEYVIRDTVIYRLRQMDETDLRDTAVQDRLRVELSEALNEVLGIDNIKTIYFNDFVMQ